MTYGKLKKNTLYAVLKEKPTTVIETSPVSPDSIVFHDATVLLGTHNVNQTKNPVLPVGDRVDGKNIGLVRTNTTSSLKKLSVFTNLAGYQNILWMV